jgi:pSer/pThr/pTyr-binding forkhead associated (FHA) protein
MNFQFTIITNDHREIPFAITKSPFVVGRKEGCDLCLDSRTVSRLHCEFKLKRVGLTIKDLASRNGTLLNGELIPSETRVAIHRGDRIQIGKYLVVVGRLVDSDDDLDDNIVEGSEQDFSHKENLSKDLLATLDELMVETLDSKAFPTAVTARASRTQEQKRSDWTVLKKNTRTPDNSQDGSDSSTDSTLMQEASQQIDSHTNDSTVIADPNETASAEIDPAEMRRLELRAKIQAMKAKDSKEAADRALKNLFGTR